MKTLSDAALAALEDGTAIVSGAILLASDPPVRLWGGYGALSIAGEVEPFQGIGDRGLAQISGASLGVAAQNVTLTLSGVEPAALALLDAEEIRDAAAVIWRLIFAGDGRTFLDGHVYDRGRVDQVKVVEQIGGPATVQVIVEGAARGLGRRGGRMASDADQRLVKAADGHLRNVSFAAEKTLYWGGKRPSRAGNAVGGTPSGGGSGGGLKGGAGWGDFNSQFTLQN